MMRGVAQKKGPSNPPGAKRSVKPETARPRAGSGNQLRQREQEITELQTPAVPRVSGLLLQRKCACGGNCETCKKKQKEPPLLRRANGLMNPPDSIPPLVQSVLSEPGRPLDGVTRESFEQRFAADFSEVRIHDDARAAESARSVHALAYTVGQDIVFDRDLYAPHHAEGRKLLAHELAHTIQQHGLQRSATSAVMPSAEEEQRLDAEADEAAARAVAGSRVPRIKRGTPSPRLSRTPRRWAGTPRRRFDDINISVEQYAGQLGFDVTARSNDPEADGVAFLINEFYLPVGKRFALDRYTTRAQAGALEAHLSWENGNVAPITQGAGTTADLNDLWLQRNNWPNAAAGAPHLLWHLAGGCPVPATTPAAGAAPPAVAAPTAAANASNYGKVTSAQRTCQVDHLMELQLGGNNVPDNMFMLDEQWNTTSGIRFTWPMLNQLGPRIRNGYYDDPNKPLEITLSFSNNIQVHGNPAQTGVPPANMAAYDRNRCLREVFGGRATQCWQVDLCSRQLLPAEIAAAGGLAAPAAGRPFPLRVAEMTVNVSTVRPTATPFVIPATDPAADLIAGLQLVRLTLRPDASRRRGAFDLVEAQIDQRTRAGRDRRSAPSLDALAAEGAIIRFNRAPDRTATENPQPTETEGRLTLLQPRKEIRFRYPYMSDMRMSVSLDPNNRAVGRGTLTPGVPLLNRAPMNIEFGDGRLRAFYGTVPRGGRPIPGGRITELSLGAELLPEFRPSGRVGLEFGPHSRPLGTVALEATADENGLVLLGDLFVQIPGTDRAQGHLEYRNSQWSGYAVVEASKIRLPGFQRGELRVDFNPNGTIRPSGSVDLLVFGNPVAIRASYEDNRLVLSGDATIRVPNLESVRLSLRHDGEHLTGSASTGITINALTGNVEIHYRDGRVTGEGRATITRPRVSGSVTLRIGERRELTGSGTATVRLTDNLVGTVGIEKPADGPLRVSGELAFPNPILLFRPIERNYTLFERRVEFGIPGLSIPVVNVGVVATVTGRLGVGYGFGPGTLENVRVGVGFNPLEETTDLAVDASARLNVPAHAELSLSIRAGAGLSAGVASITGGITGTGTVGLVGGFTGGIEFHYRNAVYSIEAEAAIRVRPVFRLGLDADITAEVGAFGYTAARWQKVWSLANFSWGADTEAGLIARLRYASNEGLTLPSAENIQWIVPSIEPGALLGDLFGQARGQARDLD
jgi:hypothetical protein